MPAIVKVYTEGRVTVSPEWGAYLAWDAGYLWEYCRENSDF